MPGASDFNPRAPHGARPTRPCMAGSCCNFNPHAPHGARPLKFRDTRAAANFNPHAPHGARRLIRITARRSLDFNPRAPRGARRTLRSAIGNSTDFNPRAPRGARRTAPRHQDRGGGISIHAPREGRDANYRGGHGGLTGFQSTHPLRGATAKVHKLLYTLLRKKARFQPFLQKAPPFKAFFRLRISKNISNRGANHHRNFCALLLRTTRSLGLPEGMSACSQSARSCFHTFFPGSKIAGYPSPDP